LAIVTVVAATGSAARGAGTGERDGACTWGASSVTASYIDGKLVMSQPQTTGCVPSNP
jgi:hypothetical protein